MTTSVRASAYYLRALPNKFENARVGYEIESDEFLEGETVDELRLRLKEKVQRWVQEDVEEIDADAKV